jgi:Tfp pilus assembly protein PilF
MTMNMTVMKPLHQCLLLVALASLTACVTDGATFKTKEIEKSSSLNNEGYDHMRDKDYAGAKPYFDKALKVEPNLAIAHLNLGAVYQNTGNKSAAAGEYRLAIANDTPENGYPAVLESTDGQLGTVTEIANRNLGRMNAANGANAK